MEILEWSRIRDEFTKLTDEEKQRALFIENHPEFPAYLLVNSLDPLYTHVLKDTIGEYRAVPKLKLDELLDAGDESGFNRLIYTRDPGELFRFIDTLDEPYPYPLNFTLKKFQLRGFNYTRDLPSCIINWSTGTGKSVYAVARAKYLLETDKVDKVVILSKSHNKINWQRTFKIMGSLDATVDDEVKGSNPSNRRTSRGHTYESSRIFIINYEKLRFRPEQEEVSYDLTGRKRPSSSGDGQELLEALKGKRVLWIWDEMPSKMKSMATGWYKGAEKILRKTKQNYQVALTATKLETNPENIYSCVKLLDKKVWPSKAVFRSMYAKRMSSFSPWQVAAWDNQRLPEIGMRLAHMTHHASKYTDPEIMAEFPQDHWEDILIDMSGADRNIYELIESKLIDDLTGDYNAIISKISPLQIVCNNPLLLEKSEGMIARAVAESIKLTDRHCSKLDTLKELLDEIPGKVVIFSMYNEFGSRMLMPYLAKWGHTFVLYDGNGKKKQEAQDRFKQDKRVKVFLSSDAGSDSIDLQEATTVINYDLPWNHSTLTQRVNRISRITSEHQHVYYYNLITAATMEERKLVLLERKRKMEEAIDGPISDQSAIISGTSLDELRWIITGR